ncbi:MAG: cellulase family glycosylhydrolase [Patescibacteria group bacterium]|jgi:hypothetical protein|nr:cellulase family glycosylhydrolase [Patescibacteria group bacterium]
MFIIKLLLKIIWYVLLFLISLVIIVGVAFNWPVQEKNEDMDFGVSFVDHHARSLELDWKETYIAILDDLGVKKVRLGAYWNNIEKSPGEFYFEDLDYQIQEAQKRDVDVILAFGIKAPRWPECFIPEFYIDDKKEREDKLLEYEKLLIERYKDYENISYWQVENEPFLPFFGDCPPEAIDAELVDREIAQVRELDPDREIIVTDSGELSWWHEAAKRADVFGTTLYRTIYKEPFGYVTYPVGPNFFRIKAMFIKYFSNQDDVIVSELQAEPWGPGWILHMSLEEQFKSMNPDIFKEIIEYTQKTKFDSAYLWGAEWWYWLKTKQNDDRMWETAREVFNENK